MATEKVLILGIQRVRGSRYFLRDQAVYRVPFFRGPPHAAQEEWVADASFEAAKGYHYFLDADGDLARVRKRVAGRRQIPRRPSAVLPRRCAPEDAGFTDLLSGLTASSLRRLASRLGLAPPGGPQQLKEVLIERGGPHAAAILRLWVNLPAMSAHPSSTFVPWKSKRKRTSVRPAWRMAWRSFALPSSA